VALPPGASSGRFLWALLPVRPAVWGGARRRASPAQDRRIPAAADVPCSRRRLSGRDGRCGGWGISRLAGLQPPFPLATGCWVVHGAGMLGWSVAGGALIQRADGSEEPAEGSAKGSPPVEGRLPDPGCPARPSMRRKPRRYPACSLAFASGGSSSTRSNQILDPGDDPAFTGSRAAPSRSVITAATWGSAASCRPRFPCHTGGGCSFLEYHPAIDGNSSRRRGISGPLHPRVI
jgi:hypothetical protein